eukprot:TRINITY_DN11398_c0_g1_i1.p1 TRINITY_DN11398_c0_g1~~TRINITY_DN11398_c0_g1_i1.p1  ORF type:complete len:391 (+),score=72.05 TRINITY_DN11398_c0_g1_i1:54-1226(+)
MEGAYKPLPPLPKQPKIGTPRGPTPTPALSTALPYLQELFPKLETNIILATLERFPKEEDLIAELVRLSQRSQKTHEENLENELKEMFSYLDDYEVLRACKVNLWNRDRCIPYLKESFERNLIRDYNTIPPEKIRMILGATQYKTDYAISILEELRYANRVIEENVYQQQILENQKKKNEEKILELESILNTPPSDTNSGNKFRKVIEQVREQKAKENREIKQQQEQLKEQENKLKESNAIKPPPELINRQTVSSSNLLITLDNPTLIYYCVSSDTKNPYGNSDIYWGHVLLKIEMTDSLRNFTVLSYVDDSPRKYLYHESKYDVAFTLKTINSTITIEVFDVEKSQKGIQKISLNRFLNKLDVPLKLHLKVPNLDKEIVIILALINGVL